MKKHIPNILTIARMGLVPAFIACFWFIDDPHICGIVSALVFGLASLTDFLDGHLARKWNIVSTLGKVLDPVADKFMVFSAVLMLAVRVSDLQWLMIWVCAIVFLRELGVTSIRVVSASQSGDVIAASFFGKAKTVTQIVCVLVVLVEYALKGIFDTYWIGSYITLAAMVFMTVASGVDYVVKYIKSIKK